MDRIDDYILKDLVERSVGGKTNENATIQWLAESLLDAYDVLDTIKNGQQALLELIDDE